MADIIIKKMTILECWCPKCGTGQMENILDDSFLLKQRLSDWIDREIECVKCKEKNTITDIVDLIPTSFNIHSHKDIEKYKKDQSMNNHLEKE